MTRFALALAALGLSGMSTVLGAQQQPPAGQTQVSTGQVAPASSSQMSSSLGVYVFPAKGQTDDQQRHDESDCYAWAKGQTGIDPIAGTPAPTAVAQQQAGGAVHGAAKGAAAGALIGAAAGNAGTGAAVGAAAGGVGGRSRQQAGNAQAQQQAQASAQQTAANNKSAFNRAFSACLEPKGYTIK